MRLTPLAEYSLKANSPPARARRYSRYGVAADCAPVLTYARYGLR